MKRHIKIKNYTSSVPVDRTVARIERSLADAGVSKIHKEYGPEGGISALLFTIKVQEDRDMTVRLPADPVKVADALYAQYLDGTSRPRKRLKDFLDQAAQTAWKLQQDWVEVQLSLIAMKQADPAEVFLAYIWDGQSTVYTRLAGSGFKHLQLTQ
jgi:hypothetical protein